MVSRRLVDLSLAIELLRTRIDYLEKGKSVTVPEASAWAAAHSVEFRKPYTVARVCRICRISRATLYRWRKGPPAFYPSAATLFSDEEIADRLRKIVAQSPFPSERYRKLWARLRRSDIHISRERVRRVIRDFEILPPRGSGILTDRPDIMWGIDSTKVGTAKDGPALILFAIDHCTAECLSIDVVQEETTAAWLRVIYSGFQYAFENLSKGCAQGLVLRHDILPLFRETAFRNPLRAFGVQFSPSPILSPQMNGCAERFVGTLRGNLLSIRYFDSVGDLAIAVTNFRNQYNEHWLLARGGYRSPAQLREWAKRRSRDPLLRPG